MLYSVNVPVVSYYEIEIEDPNMIELIEKGGLARYIEEMGLAITEKGEYKGWDIDFSKIGVVPIG